MDTCLLYTKSGQDSRGFPIKKKNDGEYVSEEECSLLGIPLGSKWGITSGSSLTGLNALNDDGCDQATPNENISVTLARLRSCVDNYTSRRELSFLEEIFEKHATDEIKKSPEPTLLVAGLQRALSDLGVEKKLGKELTSLKLEDAAALATSVNGMSDSGGLVFEEFQKILTRPHHSLEIAVPDVDVSRYKECFDAHAVQQFHRSEALADAGVGKIVKIMYPAGLRNALRELGVHMELDKAAAVVASMDLDENGGLDFEEFCMAVKRPRTAVEQWVDKLSLPGMLAACLAIPDGEGDRPLRELSNVSPNQLDIAIEVFSTSLRELLGKAQAQLKDMLETVDKKAEEIAGGGSSKFKTFRMNTGGVEKFYMGLLGRVGDLAGAPNPDFSKGMRDEHCVNAGCEVEFTSSNYGITTSPHKEYDISTGKRSCVEADMLDRRGRRVRIIQSIERLKQLKLCRRANLTEDEILAVVLYTGPMFQIYNTILRQYPQEDFRVYQTGGNLFATTIFVLASAVVKISRVTRLPPGLELFRGLGGLAELPESFWQSDQHGCRGYLEWGFLSTTSNKATAIEYSGAGQGKPLPMVLQATSFSIDRGACIKDLSQYPGEVEYLWPPCTYLEPIGPSYLEIGAAALLTMIPVRINMNGKNLTVEEIQTQKKDLYLAASRYAIDQLHRELQSVAKEGDLEGRLARDTRRDQHTTEMLLDKLEREIKQLHEEHEAVPPKRYLDDNAYRAMVVDMLDARRYAMNALQMYLEDPVFDIASMMIGCNADLHRQYIAYLHRCTLEATLEEDRRDKAVRLCKVAGLMKESADEVDSDGFTPLMKAATAGASMTVLKALIAAGGDVDSAETRDTFCRRGWTALMRSAVAGHAETATSLCVLGANVNAVDHCNSTALFVAAQFGHWEVVDALLKARADPELANTDGVTPLIVAAQDGRINVVRLLCLAGAQIDKQNQQGATALIMAAYDARLEVVKYLCEAGADLNIKAYEMTAMEHAESAGHTAVANYLRDRASEALSPQGQDS